MNYYSSGKLLLTGEYLILKGALALASPVRFGQSLKMVENNDPFLAWESFEKGICWFKAKFDTAFFKITETTDEKIATRLMSWLKAADVLNPGFLNGQKGKKAIVEADFNLSWGLGSSSSLLSNIAWWAEVDPFRLHKLVSNGSGYDVVSARADSPVFFRRDGEGYKTDRADFNPVFKGNLYFIYSGRKQDSAKSVEGFKNSSNLSVHEIERISDLTNQIASAKTLAEFEAYMKEHEEIISGVLKQKRLMEERFADLEGEIKSLGAWGGDFAMMTWHKTKEELKAYLKTKNIDTFFPFDEIIKQGEI
jgi:mevalonate kinase